MKEMHQMPKLHGEKIILTDPVIILAVYNTSEELEEAVRTVDDSGFQGESIAALLRYESP
jgi:hypothetical protein